MSDDQGESTPNSVQKINSENFISEALAKAQGEFRQPDLNRTAEIKKDGKLLYTTTYADLNQCIECIRQPLSKHGLSFTQTVEPDGNLWLLILTLRHASGQTLRSYMPLSLNGSPQQIGGQLTYLKRYQISAFFGLAADFDDDGNAGSNTGNTGDFKQKTKAKAEFTSGTGLSKSIPAGINKVVVTTSAGGPIAVGSGGSAGSMGTSPQKFILPNWGGSNKGKALGTLDTPTLEKLKKFLKEQIFVEPAPKHVKEIPAVLANIKAVLADREPPTPPPGDDIPENKKVPRPEDESQTFPPDDTTVPPTIDEFEIPKGVLDALDPIAGIPLKKISEKELRAAQKILDDEMKKGPKGKITAAAGFELRNKITEFFNSMGG